MDGFSCGIHGTHELGTLNRDRGAAQSGGAHFEMWDTEFLEILDEGERYEREFHSYAVNACGSGVGDM